MIALMLKTKPTHKLHNNNNFFRIRVTSSMILKKTKLVVYPINQIKYIYNIYIIITTQCRGIACHTEKKGFPHCHSTLAVKTAMLSALYIILLPIYSSPDPCNYCLSPIPMRQLFINHHASAISFLAFLAVPFEFSPSFFLCYTVHGFMNNLLPFISLLHKVGSCFCEQFPLYL